MSRFPYRQFPHKYCGSNSDRQSVGNPGHCEDCVSVGHLVAHPEWGCGDVGCNSEHPEPDVSSEVRSQLEDVIGGGLTNRELNSGRNVKLAQLVVESGLAAKEITHDQIKGIATDLYRAGLTNTLNLDTEAEIASILQRNGLVVQQ